MNPSPEALWSALLLSSEALARQCRRETYQGSGAGGQKRNRVRSGVRLVHEATGMRAENCEHREAARNVDAAAAGLRLAMALRLGEMAAQDFEAGADSPPSSDAESGRRAPAPPERLRIEANPAHEDYAITAASALTALARHRGRLAEAASHLGVTGSALTRHLKGEKQVWAAVLRLREKSGLPPLK